MARSKTKRLRKAGEKAGEVRIYISPVMFVMAVYFVAMGMAYQYVCSLAAVLLHECAHAKVAKKLGYELNVVKLMPYGAALCGDVQMRAKHEIAVAAAGPIFNLITAALCAALWWLVPTTYAFTQAFCACNLYIGLFNLLPVYPLDGGRVTFALLTKRLNRDKAYKIMRIISAVFGVITIGLFALSAVYSLNLCLLSVGLFMLVSAFVPDKKAKYTTAFALANRKSRMASPLEVRTFVVSSAAPLASLVTMLDADRFTNFEVVNADTLRCMFTVDETTLIDAVKAHGYGMTAGGLDTIKH
ncbi:MAG: hypothetical protein HDT28_06620 [Clostridiales bacterium]|nr:hypothetical protein [Clostridiales bacterium]